MGLARSSLLKGIPLNEKKKINVIDLKIPTGGGQISLLFTRLTKELKSTEKILQLSVHSGT